VQTDMGILLLVTANLMFIMEIKSSTILEPSNARISIYFFSSTRFPEQAHIRNKATTTEQNIIENSGKSKTHVPSTLRSL
jgi:hypothetical protein